MILKEKTKIELGVDFDSCKVYTDIFCKCDYCGKIFKRTKRNIQSGRKFIEKESCNSKLCAKSKREESQLLLYNVKNAGGIDSSVEKQKKTFLKKYGVDNPSKVKEIREKQIKTSLKNHGVESFLETKECREALEKKAYELYGVNNFSKSNEVKDKIKETCLKKYGSNGPMGNSKVRKKSKETCLKKYGVDNVNKVKEVREKQVKTLLKNHGVDSPLKSKHIKNKQEKTLVQNYGVKTPLQSQELKEKAAETCKKKYGHKSLMQNKKIFKKSLVTKLEKYGSYFTNFKKTEKEICSWLNSFNLDFKQDIDILCGKELDMYDKNLSLAIEYCGLYWHHENSLEPRKKEYHFKKYENCLKKGVQLITIFEDEWFNKKEQCKNFLMSKINVFNKNVYARKCEIKNIEKKEAKSFYEKNHIQGSSRGMLVAYGLFYQEELLAVMSLGKHHRNSKKITLDRFCIKSEYKVPGGASKLFKKCIAWAKEKKYSKIISWSDNRWSKGDVYECLGFKLDGDLKPDYSYVNIKNPNKKRISKQSQAKKKTGCPEGKTEHEWCLEKGLSRIWDCGKKRWVYEL